MLDPGDLQACLEVLAFQSARQLRHDSILVDVDKVEGSRE